VGYLAAGLLQMAATLATRLLMHVLDPFLFPALLALVLVALVALTWGAGPSLLATLVGVVLLDYCVLPPLVALTGTRPDQPVAGLLVIAAGVVISIAVSQTERARRDAQASSAMTRPPLHPGGVEHRLSLRRPPLTALLPSPTAPCCSPLLWFLPSSVDAGDPAAAC
jgi:K+-sensing histidine kinase KdpD